MNISDYEIDPCPICDADNASIEYRAQMRMYAIRCAFCGSHTRFDSDITTVIKQWNVLSSVINKDDENEPR